MPTEERKPLALRTKIRPYGEIAAVACLSGERYYFFVDDAGRSVAMMPADVIEETRHAE